MPEYLEQDRSNASKPFSMGHGKLVGRSAKDLYMADKDFKDADDLHTKCLVYASAYTETMLTRAQVEDPEIFAVKGMNKSEMQQNMIHNMCLPYKKLHAKMFREATARINEKNYLEDDIRRLYNGGDKFHPYV